MIPTIHDTKHLIDSRQRMTILLLAHALQHTSSLIDSSYECLHCFLPACHALRERMTPLLLLQLSALQDMSATWHCCCSCMESCVTGTFVMVLLCLLRPVVNIWCAQYVCHEVSIHVVNG
jgi:hypothetical protein